MTSTSYVPIKPLTTNPSAQNSMPTPISSPNHVVSEQAQLEGKKPPPSSSVSSHHQPPLKPQELRIAPAPLLYQDSIPVYYHPFIAPSHYPQPYIPAHSPYIHQGVPLPHPPGERFERIRPKLPGPLTTAYPHYPLAALPPTTPSSPSHSQIKSPHLGIKNDREMLRKVSHSAIERRRRERINDKIMEIKSIVPSCAQRDNLHKFSILQNSIEYIEKLQQYVNDVILATTSLSNISADKVTSKDLDRMKEIGRKGTLLLRKEVPSKSSTPTPIAPRDCAWTKLPIAPTKSNVSSPPITNFLGVLGNNRDTTPGMFLTPTTPLLPMPRPPPTHLVPIQPSLPLPIQAKGSQKGQESVSSNKPSKEKRDATEEVKSTKTKKARSGKADPQHELDGLASDTLLMLSNSGSRTPSPPDTPCSGSNCSTIKVESEDLPKDISENGETPEDGKNSDLEATPSNTSSVLQEDEEGVEKSGLSVNSLLCAS